MNCLQARTILLQVSDGTPASSAEGLAASHHAAGCQDCRLFFAQEKKFSSAMQKRFPRRHAPPRLRESVLQGVANERKKAEVRSTPFRTRFRLRESVLGAIALAATLLLLTLFFLSRQDEVGWTESVLNLFIQDHLAMKLKEHPLDVETSDNDRLQRWLAARVDFNVTVPRPAALTLKGGHLCLIGGKRSVSLSFEKDAVPLTLYMIDQKGADLAGLKRVSIVSGNSVFLYDSKGCNILLWQQRGLVYALISDLSEEELVAIVPQVS
ncbi:MAG: DUF4367 domain-containing protein [Bacteroidota bacterium]